MRTKTITTLDALTQKCIDTGKTVTGYVDTIIEDYAKVTESFKARIANKKVCTKDFL